MDTIPRVARECRVHSVHPVMQRSNLSTNAEDLQLLMHLCTLEYVALYIKGLKTIQNHIQSKKVRSRCMLCLEA